MKKFTVMLLALFLITGLCSCGGKDHENAEPSASPSVTEKAPETEKKQTEQEKEKETTDDGIVLPEDGKIEFGKDNKEQISETQKPEQPKEQPKAEQPKEQPKAEQPQEQPKQEKEPENQTETKPSSADEQGYGEVTWN